jgi:hypothetical protein
MIFAPSNKSPPVALALNAQAGPKSEFREARNPRLGSRSCSLVSAPGLSRLKSGRMSALATRLTSDSKTSHLLVKNGESNGIVSGLECDRYVSAVSPSRREYGRLEREQR